MKVDPIRLNHKEIPLRTPSDRAVVARVASQMQRRVTEDDWRPFRSKQEALRAWSRLGGIRVQVLKALHLI